MFALFMEPYAMIQVSILVSVTNLWNSGVAISAVAHLIPGQGFFKAFYEFKTVPQKISSAANKIGILTLNLDNHEMF